MSLKSLLARLMVIAGFRIELVAFRLDPDAAQAQSNYEFSLDPRNINDIYLDAKSNA